MKITVTGYRKSTNPKLSASVSGSIELTNPDSTILVKPKLTGTNVQPTSEKDFTLTVQYKYTYKIGKRKRTTWQSVSNAFEIVEGSYDAKTGSFRVRRIQTDENTSVKPGTYRIILGVNGGYYESKGSTFKVKQSKVKLETSAKTLVMSRYDRNASKTFDIEAVKPAGVSIVSVQNLETNTPFRISYDATTGKVRVEYADGGYNRVKQELVKQASKTYTLKLRAIVKGEYDTGKALNTITIKIQVE